MQGHPQKLHVLSHSRVRLAAMRHVLEKLQAKKTELRAAYRRASTKSAQTLISARLRINARQQEKARLELGEV